MKKKLLKAMPLLMISPLVAINNNPQVKEPSNNMVLASTILGNNKALTSNVLNEGFTPTIDSQTVQFQGTPSVTPGTDFEATLELQSGLTGTYLFPLKDSQIGTKIIVKVNDAQTIQFDYTPAQDRKTATIKVKKEAVTTEATSLSIEMNAERVDFKATITSDTISFINQAKSIDATSEEDFSANLELLNTLPSTEKWLFPEKDSEFTTKISVKVNGQFVLFNYTPAEDRKTAVIKVEKDKYPSTPIENFVVSIEAEKQPEHVYATKFEITDDFGGQFYLDTFARISEKPKYVVEPANCTEKVIWTSSQPAICSVAEDGTITANNQGTATIKGTILKSATEVIEHSFTVNVVAHVYKVNITNVPEKYVDLYQGENFDLKAEILPASASNPKIHWVSDDPSLVTVNKEGHVEAVGSSGSCFVRAFSEDSPTVCDEVEFNIINSEGKYSARLDVNNKANKDTRGRILDIKNNIGTVTPTKYCYGILPGQKSIFKNTDVLSTEQNIKIRSIQIFYLGGSLSYSLTNDYYQDQSQIPAAKTPIISGAKVYSFSEFRNFIITNTSGTDDPAYIYKINIDFGYGEEYTVASNFKFGNGDGECIGEEGWKIDSSQGMTSIYANTHGGTLKGKQYLTFRDVKFTCGTIEYDTNVTADYTSDLLPKGFTLFAKDENSSYYDRQLFTGVKTAASLDTTTKEGYLLGRGLEGYMTEYNQSRNPYEKGYAYPEGGMPSKMAPEIKDGKTRCKIVVEKNSEIAYDDRTVSMYSHVGSDQHTSGVFKTQNVTSVYDGKSRGSWQTVGLSLNQEGAAVSNITITSYDEANLWDGTLTFAEFDGEGTAEKPFLINTAQGLALFASIINNKEYKGKVAGKDWEWKDYTTAHYKLTSDISLNGQTWTSIGRWNTFDDPVSFCGEFDGGGHRITGISATGIQGSGLFGSIGTIVNKDGKLSSANIHDLHITGIFSSGSGYVGPLSTYIDGSCTLKNIQTEGYASSSSGTIGGVIGEIYTMPKIKTDVKIIIDNCVNRCLLYNQHYTSNDTYTGGIIGEISTNAFTEFDLQILNCKNLGTIVAPSSSQLYLYCAGILPVSVDGTTISNCVNLGNINTYSSNVRDVAGIVAYLKGGIVNNCGCYREAVIAGIKCREFNGTTHNKMGSIVGDKGKNATLDESSCYFCDINGQPLSLNNLLELSEGEAK